MEQDTSSGILPNNLENTLQDAEEIVTKPKSAAWRDYQIQYIYDNLNGDTFKQPKQKPVQMQNQELCSGRSMGWYEIGIHLIILSKSEIACT